MIIVTAAASNYKILAEEVGADGLALERKITFRNIGIDVLKLFKVLK